MEPMVSHGRSNRSSGSAESQIGHHQDRNTKIATIQKIFPPPPAPPPLSIFLSLPPSLHPVVVPSGYCEIVSMEMWVRAVASPAMLQCEFGCEGFKPQQAAPGWRDGWMDGPMVKRRKQKGDVGSNVEQWDSPVEEGSDETDLHIISTTSLIIKSHDE